MDNEESYYTIDQENRDDYSNLLHINSEQAEVVFSALSSTKARRILSLLHQEPRAISALADELGTSIQSVQYHIRNLRDAELIKVIDTEYSPKRTEMKIFAPTSEALILFSGPESESEFKSHLWKFLAAVGALGIVAVAVHTVANWMTEPIDDPGMTTPIPHGPNGDTPTPSPTPTLEPVTEVVSIDPGLVFFGGGLFALVITILIWHYF